MKIRTWLVPLIAPPLLAAIMCLSGYAAAGVERSAESGGVMQTVETNIRQAVAQVDATGESLKELLKPDQADLKKAYDIYAANVAKLDNMAMPLDKHINQINSLGKDYFSEWEKRGDEYTDPGIRALSERRRADLGALYARIPRAGVGVMSALHAYMSYIIETRTYLSHELTPAGIEAITPVALKALKEGGDFQDGLKRVLTAMERAKAGMASAKGE